MAYEYESKETRVLKTIDSQRYPETNKDFVKNIRRLNSSVDYISSYMRIMQKGIDDANKSFIEQIQSFINDLIVIFAGGEPTGIELGDLKYILQAIGALFGFNGPFPVNLFNAAAHFFQGFLAPITQLSDLIFDTIEAWMLDLIDKAGNIPIIGGAVVSLAQWIIDSSNGIQQAIEAAADAFAHAGEIIDSFLRALGVPTWADVEKWFENLFGGLLYGIDFGDGFDLFEAAQWFINIVLFPVNLLAKLVGGFLEVFRIPGLDASKITSGTFAQSMISGLVDALGNLGKFINDVIDAIEGAFRGIPIFGSGIANMINGIQQFFNGLFGAPTPQPTIQAPAVPGIDATKVTTGTFGSGQIADAAVTQAKIADSAVSGGKIADLAVGTTKVADSAITGAKTTTLDATKITSGTITPGIIGDASITGTKIAGTTITANNIVNSTITGTKIATGTIGGGNIAGSTITGSNIAGSTIAGGNIAGSTITGGNIAGSTITGSNVAQNTITGGNTTGLDATKITTGRLGASQLPESLSTVGSGVTLYRTGSTSQPLTYWDANGRKIPWGFYDPTNSVVTPDITVLNIGGFTAARVSNAGWYMAEVSYQLRGGGDYANFSYHWGLTPCIYKSSGSNVPTVIHKWGGTGVCVVDSNVLGTNSWTTDFASGNFIVYLNANETIFPGYFWTREGTAASDTIIISTSTAGAYGTYFSMSLLNRSLA